jgi:hypothetical protein
MFQIRVVEKIKTYYLSGNSFPKIVLYMKNVKKYVGARQATDHENIIWGLCFACWINKATCKRICAQTHTHTHAHTHTQNYVIVLAFPRQQWFCDSASFSHYMYIIYIYIYVYMYICIICISSLLFFSCVPLYVISLILTEVGFECRN